MRSSFSCSSSESPSVAWRSVETLRYTPTTTVSVAVSPPGGGGGDTSQEPIIVGLYLRVSTDRQANEGDSLEEQENELKKYCDYRNFRIHKLYIERG
ncbi:recombinase family protein, partial [bacterium]|nr:recombinase family protein [bacterium]